jgi:hypothetical protein
MVDVHDVQLKAQPVAKPHQEVQQHHRVDPAGNGHHHAVP